MTNSKSGLAIALSKLQAFPSPKPNLEQYPTDSEVAAEVLWNAHMLGDIEAKTIADLGCGTGILGIGALLLGAKKVLFIDTDKDALGILARNLEDTGITKRASIINADIADFKKKVDVVLQNPPFGTREKHIDRVFLEKATSLTSIIYSFHKTSTRKFVESFAKDNSFSITNRWDFDFPLKQSMEHHRKRIQRIEVSCFRLEAMQDE
jgi:putative methylase